MTHEGTDVQAANRAALDAVRIRRDALYEAVLGLERAIGVPAGDDPRGWAVHVGTAVAHLEDVLHRHVVETEAAGGFFDDVVERNPGLAPAAQKLRAEHAPLAARLAALDARLADVDGDDEVDAIRREALDVMTDLLAHRHRGAELVYDAYAIDVAAGD